MPVDLNRSSRVKPGVDDWLSGSDLDWFGDVRATRRAPSQDAAVVATAGPPRHEGHPAEATIRRRRAVGLLVLLVMLGGLIWIAVAAFGGGSGESAGETLHTTTAQQPSVSTPTTPTTTPPSVATTPPLTVDLPTGEKLRRGSSGDIVKQLQEGLTALGFEPGPADGDYGPVTEAAVVEFQQSKGLAVDGVVGVNTARELNAALAALPAADSRG